VLSFESLPEELSMNSSDGVSEIVGAILLISLVVIAASIVAVIVLSQPPPEDIPRVNALAENRSNTIYIIHNGGDPLQQAWLKVIVNGQESPFTIEGDGNRPWSAGKILKVTYPGPGMPEYLEVVYDRGSVQAIIYRASFIPAAP